MSGCAARICADDEGLMVCSKSAKTLDFARISAFLGLSTRTLAGPRFRSVEIEPHIVLLAGRWSVLRIVRFSPHFRKKYCNEFAFLPSQIW